MTNDVIYLKFKKNYLNFFNVIMMMGFSMMYIFRIDKQKRCNENKVKKAWFTLQIDDEL